MTRFFSALALLYAVFIPLGSLFAQDALPPAPYAYQQLDDPRQEEAARELMHTLRCLQCQSQSIADSDATMAGDMRHQVRLRIAQGQSPDEVRTWMMQRYGDYISFEPELSGATWPLFAIPFIIALLAGLALWLRFREGRTRGE